jgi:hypothetical protein
MTISSGGFLYGFLKGAERPGPHLIEVRAQTGHPLRIELIEPARACFGIGHKAHILQHFEVLRNSRTRNWEHPRELVHGDGPSGELLKDRHPRRIGEGIEPGL